jgi:hypothetical protein
MAYRLIGLAARMCLEMGLHRRDALMKSFPNEDQWNEITRLFWTVYSLDRRWSLGTGLPFVIQDEDVDPNLPEPVCLDAQPLKTCHWLIIICCRTRLYPIYDA